MSTSPGQWIIDSPLRKKITMYHLHCLPEWPYTELRGEIPVFEIHA